jgi:SWI/SNF-related matrix-associated actin-dependent regulator of chromatin subfamily A3
MELEPQLIWATPKQRGFGGGSSHTGAGRMNPPAAPYLPMPTPTQSQSTPSQTAARMEATRKQQEALQKAAELRQMLNSLEKVDDDNRRSSLLDTLCATEDVLSMPTYATPPGISSGELTVDLMKHQVCTVFHLS